MIAMPLAPAPPPASTPDVAPAAPASQHPAPPTLTKAQQKVARVLPRLGEVEAALAEILGPAGGPWPYRIHHQIAKRLSISRSSAYVALGELRRRSAERAPPAAPSP